MQCIYSNCNCSTYRKSCSRNLSKFRKKFCDFVIYSAWKSHQVLQKLGKIKKINIPCALKICENVLHPYLLSHLFYASSKPTVDLILLSFYCSTQKIKHETKLKIKWIKKKEAATETIFENICSFIQKHLFLDYFIRICVYRTDNNFQGRYICSSYRYQFSRNSFTEQIHRTDR